MITLEKFTTPSDRASSEEYGTKWVANLESGVQIFIQTSLDKEQPKWVRLGTIVEFLELNNGLEQGTFINDALVLYSRINNKE